MSLFAMLCCNILCGIPALIYALIAKSNAELILQRGGVVAAAERDAVRENISTSRGWAYAAIVCGIVGKDSLSYI